MMILNWLKWRIAARELSELERWKIEWETLRRWLAEFPDVAIALDHLQAGALGSGGRPSIFSLREMMRTQMHTRICGYEPWQDKSTADQVHIALIKNLRGQLTESVARIEDLERQLYAAKTVSTYAQQLAAAPVQAVPEADMKAAAKAIYDHFPPQKDGSPSTHPWRDGGNSNMQDLALRMARAALESQPAAAPVQVSVVPEDWEQLMQFYDAANAEELVKAQEDHIAELQAKLRKLTPRQPVFTKVRAG